MYFASITYHLLKGLPINRSYSQPFCLVKQREIAMRDKTKRLHGRQIPYTVASYCVVTKAASPQTIKTREALRDKTKSCCTRLTCRHDNTKSYSLLLTI